MAALEFDPYLDEVYRSYPDFANKTLEALDLPPIESVPDIEDHPLAFVRRFGDTNEAKGIMFVHVQGTTKLTDDTVAIRLAAMHHALGEEYAVVGVETYRPRDLKISNINARKDIKDGDFSYFAKRFGWAIDFVGPRSDQEVYLHGFSFGADVAAEYVYQGLTNEIFDAKSVDKLSVIEATRTKRTTPSRFALDFKDAGADLYQNVKTSESLALNEASGINPERVFDKLTFDRRIFSGVGRYALLGGLDFLAINSGFATDASHQQLETIARSSNMSLIVGRASRGITNPYHASILGRINDTTDTLEVDGDHSIVDHLPHAMAFALIGAGLELPKAA